MGDLLLFIIAMYIFLNGFAWAFGFFFGKPQQAVIRFNSWLFRANCSGLGAFFIALGRAIKP